MHFCHWHAISSDASLWSTTRKVAAHKRRSYFFIRSRIDLSQGDSLLADVIGS